jgi:hypothetical protein
MASFIMSFIPWILGIRNNTPLDRMDRNLLSQNLRNIKKEIFPGELAEVKFDEPQLRQRRNNRV